MKAFPARKASARHTSTFISLLAGTILLFSLFSCSDSDSRITGLVSNIVLDWSDWESMPSARLSVFAETSLDERAVHEIRAVHNQSGLEWQCRNPRIIAASKNTTWAGYTNFVAAQGESIPQGSYTLYYQDMAGLECQSSFSVSYPYDLLSSTAAAFREMRIDREENIALYDADGLLLYYGERKEGWTTNADIKKDYGVAEKIRVCYRLYSGNTVCMMPAENL